MTIPPHSLAAIRQPAFMLDAGGRVAAANDLAEGLAGRPLAGLTAPEAAALLTCRRPDGTTLAPAELSSCRALRGEEVVEEPLVVTAADGRTLNVLATASPIREGDAIVGALVLWQDVTGRARAEAALQESERRHAFLLALGDRLRELGDIQEITAVASEMLGRHLGANGVVYCEVEPAGVSATVRADWNDGTVPDLAGRYRMDDFGIGEGYRQGLVRRTEDVAAALDGTERDEHAALAIRASLGVPVCRGGRLAAVLAVHSARPRSWTDAEVELVRQTADRVAASVERARAEEALRLSEERLRLAQESAQIGIWDRDVATDTVTIFPEYLRRYGLEEIAISSYADLVPLIHTEDREQVEAGRSAALASGETASPSVPCRPRRRAGNRIPLPLRRSSARGPRREARCPPSDSARQDRGRPGRRRSGRRGGTRRARRAARPRRRERRCAPSRAGCAI
jgi:GAF domain-containing protein